jgi:hypothetical protein
MAKVLTEGGFATEALAPMRDAVEVGQCRPLLYGRVTLPLIARLREDQLATDEAQAGNLLTQGERLLSQAAALLESTPGG